jgi:prepilin-type N-terminal cleavage/methylation domain-containing protein
VGTRPNYAFTVVELMVVMVLIGILMALSAPMIGAARDAARAGETLSNLRGHTAVFSSYLADYRDQYPAITSTKASYSVVRCESADVAIRARYFDASVLWGIALADQYYGGDWASRSFQSGWARSPGRRVAGLVWSCSFLADPNYYDPRRRTVPPTQLRTTRGTEIKFSSAKGMLTAYTPWVRFGRILSSTADGRAQEFQSSQLMREYSMGDGPYAEWGAHWPSFTPMCHTVRGLQGRDLR